jgi:nucleotide-binding universal stress UspA family protein
MGEDTAVIVLIDGSEETLRAALFASGLAARARTRLVVVSPAFTNPVPIGSGGRLPPDVSAAVHEVRREDAYEEADRRLHDIRRRLELTGSVELRIAEVGQSLAESVLVLLERERCLTMVLPRRGPGWLMRLLGDDTDDIVKRSRVPVTLVP